MITVVWDIKRPRAIDIEESDTRREFYCAEKMEGS